MTWLTDAKVTTQAQKLADKSVSEQQRLTADFKGSADLTVSYLGHIFQADKDSRELLAQTLVIGSLPDGFYWLDSDNVKVPMTLPELKGLAAAMLAAGFIKFNVLQTKKTQLRQAKSLDEIDAIVQAS